HPVTDDWSYHDGIGAVALQTSKGSSPADFENINNGALGMAFPIAKSRALKNACYGFGKFFGSDLNREDTLDYQIDANLNKESLNKEDWKMLKESVRLKKMTVKKADELYELSADQRSELFNLQKEK